MRREAARDYVEGSRRSMTEIAGLPGFASSAAFNAWFATRWRQLQPHPRGIEPPQDRP